MDKFKQGLMPKDDYLKLAVVGHTNTGKTSLLRTLLHDADFGEVANAPATTRHVEGAMLRIDELKLQWYDTPGIEDSISLLDYLEQLQQQEGRRLDGPAIIERFLDSPESQGRFEQEARVLRQLLLCDAGLYVVDVREPVRSKHRDELAILARCGRPIIPVLNFLHSPDNFSEQWKEVLSRLGLHLIIEFDTVAPAIDGEQQLYQKLALVLDEHRDVLRDLAEGANKRRQRRRQQGQELLAELLIDVSAFRRQSDEDESERVWQDMQDAVRQRENKFIRDLLALYRFHETDYEEDLLPISGERWESDLFSSEALMDMGIRVGKGFAAGAMAGATVDIITGGLSLGTGTLVGGLVGGLWQGAEKVGNRLLGMIQGYRELTVDDAVLRLLAVRGLSLLDALDRRGHAAQDRIQRHDSEYKSWQEESLPRALKNARSYPEWSTLNKDFKESRGRNEELKELSHSLNA
jgi:GTPase SAR1 family protein